MPVKQIWLKREKRRIKKKKDQLPEATPSASRTLFQFAHCYCTAASLLHPSRWKQLLGPDVAGLTSGVGGGGGPLAALLLGCLLQSALRGGRALEPLRGDGGLMGHALPHHVPFPPQRDLLRGSQGRRYVAGHRSLPFVSANSSMPGWAEPSAVFQKTPL